MSALLKNNFAHSNSYNKHPCFGWCWICLDLCIKNHPRVLSWLDISSIARIMERVGSSYGEEQIDRHFQSGSSFGTCLIFPIAGFLANSSWGWRSIFYFTGAVGVLWSIAWYFVAYDTTADHPRCISSPFSEERLCKCFSEPNRVPGLLFKISGSCKWMLIFLNCFKFVL